MSARGKDVCRASEGPGKSAEFKMSRLNIIRTARGAKSHNTKYMC
jgi:hypothetical protein